MSILELLLLLALASVSAGGTAALFGSLLGRVERGQGIGVRVAHPAPARRRRR